MNVKAFDSALDFVPNQPKARKGGPLATVGSWFAAVDEGITLAAEYRDLTARGVPSNVAVRKLFEQIKR